MSEWTDLKDRKGSWGYSEDNKEYIVFKDEGSRHHEITLDKAEYQTVDTDSKDFYDNIKPMIDSGDFSLSDKDGHLIVYPSPKPSGKTTLFSGAGDNSGISLGNKIVFDMTASDISKTITLTYDEDVFIKEGLIIFKDAPLGSNLDVIINHPVDGEVSSFCRALNLLGTGIIDLNPSDSGFIPFGLEVQIILYNSDGTGSEEAAGIFKVAGNIEMYRVTTV